MSDQIRVLIDNSRVTGVQISVIAICFFLNMVDGMDVLAISFAAPAIANEWSVSPQSLGVVFGAALVGMTVGAVFLSPFSDIIGRRKLILASLLLVSVGMVATAQANSITALIVLRFLAGIGIGSLLSSMTSMVSEYAPDRWRNLFILVLHAGYPIGAIIAGLVAAEILPLHGWRPLFVFAGVVSLAAFPLVFFLLPESLEFLARKQPKGALGNINAVLRKMGATTIDALPALLAAEKAKVSVTTLLRDPFRRSTIKLWLAFFMGFATLYFLLSWVVKLAIDSGLALENAIYAGVCLNLGAFFGSISLGAASNRFGLTRVIALFFLAAAISIVVYGSAKASVAIVLLLVFVLMFFVQGAFTGLYAVAARMYPTEIRTTGIGWAIGAGRLGAIFGPVSAGVVLGAGVSIAWTFALFAIPMILAAIFVSQIRLPAAKPATRASS